MDPTMNMGMAMNPMSGSGQMDPGQLQQILALLQGQQQQQGQGNAMDSGMNAQASSLGNSSMPAAPSPYGFAPQGTPDPYAAMLGGGQPQGLGSTPMTPTGMVPGQ